MPLKSKNPYSLKQLGLIMQIPQGSVHRFMNLAGYETLEQVQSQDDVDNIVKALKVSNYHPKPQRRNNAMRRAAAALETVDRMSSSVASKNYKMRVKKQAATGDKKAKVQDEKNSGHFRIWRQNLEKFDTLDPDKQLKVVIDAVKYLLLEYLSLADFVKMDLTYQGARYYFTKKHWFSSTKFLVIIDENTITYIGRD